MLYRLYGRHYYIFSKTFGDHIRDLRAVFTRLREAGLTLKLTKCSFAKNTLPYLG